MSTTNAEKPFEPGENIEFCDDEFVVLENHGNTGKVREAGKGGQVIEPFRWTFQGAECRRVVKAS